MLTLRILDPKVQFLSPGAVAAMETKPTKIAHAVPSPRTPDESRPSDVAPI